MRPYIIDKVAFLGYLANSLPSNANNTFKQAEKKKRVELTITFNSTWRNPLYNMQRERNFWKKDPRY